MVCTLKHLSLCPEMEALYLFNPENDMALACGDPYYMAPGQCPANGGRVVRVACMVWQNREELYGWILLCV